VNNVESEGEAVVGIPLIGSKDYILVLHIQYICSHGEVLGDVPYCPAAVDTGLRLHFELLQGRRDFSTIVLPLFP